MKILEVLKPLITRLSTHSDNAKNECYFLCENLLGLGRADIYNNIEVTNRQIKILSKAVKKRCKGVPLQLIIGFSDFLGVKIIESKHTLSPRPETELLADTIIKRESPESNVLDLCSGSGCIGLALKKAGFEEVTLADISKKAIKCSLRNAVLNNLPVTIVKSDMFEAILGQYDIVVSNPPYICSEEISTLSTEVKKYDPHISLDGGHDGLDFYRILTDEAHKYLLPNGVLYLEIGKNQENDIAKLLQKHFKNITILKDYNNINRIIRAEKC